MPQSSVKKIKKNFYVVTKGKKPGIYTDWATCAANVMKVSGSKYKKFARHKEAEQFFLENNSQENVDISTILQADRESEVNQIENVEQVVETRADNMTLDKESDWDSDETKLKQVNIDKRLNSGTVELINKNKNCSKCSERDNKYMIQCSDCQKRIHYYCTKLPPYMLTIFKEKKQRKFTCEDCVSVDPNIKDHVDSFSELVSNTTKTMPNEESQNTNAKEEIEHSQTEWMKLTIDDLQNKIAYSLVKKPNGFSQYDGIRTRTS